MKLIFSKEIRQIEIIRNSLKNYQKINGTQVILSQTNRGAVDDAIEHIHQALLLLGTIK